MYPRIILHLKELFQRSHKKLLREAMKNMKLTLKNNSMTAEESNVP